MKKDKKWSIISWLKRGYTASFSLLKTKTINSQVESGLDRAVLSQIRRYANTYKTEDIGKVNPYTSTRWASHTELAKQAIENAKDVTFEREYLKSEQHCKHLEAGNGVDANDDYVTIPLGRPTTILSGALA